MGIMTESNRDSSAALRLDFRISCVGQLRQEAVRSVVDI